MKAFTISTAVAALLASMASAAPAPAPATPDQAPETRQFQAQITFFGAHSASFSLSVPTDGSEFSISNPLSVSKIQSLGGATCGFTGIDGSRVVTVGAQTVDVGPPQTQISGSCLAF
ncbi:MAG: hypothetical protein Q9216_004739 [Gyalolechia sp. 2 TL-2023]